MSTHFLKDLQKLVDKNPAIESICSMDEPEMKNWFDTKSPRFRNAFVINFTSGEKIVFNEKTYKDLGNGQVQINDICQWGAPTSYFFEV